MISVIIPTLNEAAHLPATLESIRVNEVAHEVVVVDGGSEDGTPQVAEKTGVRVVISARRQRAAQMNLGAASARGDALLFLHADTRLSPGALSQIERALRNRRVVGGAFWRWFDSPSLLLRASCCLGAVRAWALGWHFGDQAMFTRRPVFSELQGFADLDLFEDLDFSRRMKAKGRVALLRPAVVSSARRYARRGPLLTLTRDVWLTCGHLAGWSPAAKKNPRRIRSGGE